MSLILQLIWNRFKESCKVTSACCLLLTLGGRDILACCSTPQLLLNIKLTSTIYLCLAISNHECSPVRCSDVREVENVIFESLHALHFSDPVPLVAFIVALSTPLQRPLDAELGPYGAESAHHISYSPTGN